MHKNSKGEVRSSFDMDLNEQSCSFQASGMLIDERQSSQLRMFFNL